MWERAVDLDKEPRGGTGLFGERGEPPALRFRPGWAPSLAAGSRLRDELAVALPASPRTGGPKGDGNWREIQSRLSSGVAEVDCKEEAEARESGSWDDTGDCCRPSRDCGGGGCCGNCGGGGGAAREGDVSGINSDVKWGMAAAAAA